MGVCATVDGSRVEVGADRYMSDLGLDVGGFADTEERLGSEGKSPMYAAIDGQLAAIIADADPIKPSTPDAIATRHKQLGRTKRRARIYQDVLITVVPRY